MLSQLLESLLLITTVIALTPILGSYMANIFTGQTTLASKALGWLEHLSYRMGGIDPKEEMSWKKYGTSLFLFNLCGFIFLFFLQLAQGFLPLNPEEMKATSLSLAFNTAISFVTNTNWQAYSGETTLSYLTQMVGLTSQNFLSAATGMAALLALTRGFIQRTSDQVGNFWVDIIRTVIYLLLPLSIIFSFVLIAEGVIQTFSPYVEITTVEGGKQTIPLGPVASQVAIKQLGTNGGGFFNANSAHPFENPTPLTNFLEMIAILLIPAASVYMYGLMVGSKKHGFRILSAMVFLWFIGVATAFFFEQIKNPMIDGYPNVEGQETRLGTANSLLWTISTTTTANGSVNAMISSLSPITGGIAMFNIMIGEMIFGGVGVGLCSMIMMILLTVFISGLMVGRTPEYMGKKIEKREMQWVVMAVLVHGILTLTLASISTALPVALAGLGNQGPHGLSEILYAFASTAGNNGSAFSGLNVNTTYYNVLLGLTILIGRVAIILPSLAIAGLLAKKKITPPSAGTFSTNSLLFVLLLIGVILIIGALTYFPALSLGPIVEHLLMTRGILF